MFTARHAHHELVWWMFLMALAALLTLLLANTPLYGIDDSNDPATPSQSATETWAEAVSQFRGAQFEAAAESFADTAGGLSEYGIVDPRQDAGLSVWNVLVTHARGDLNEAINGWQEVPLPEHAEVWRHVATAAALLELDRQEEASIALDAAWDADRENAVVHYYTALWNLNAARRSHEWLDAWTPEAFRFTSRPVVAPNSKDTYQLAAMQQFEKALELAPNIERGELLVPTTWTHEPVLRPSVDDLLRAVGGYRFEGMSHSILGTMFLDRGQMELAEEHLDQAVAHKAPVAFSYQELAEEYEELDRPFDAARAYAKSLADGSAGSGQLRAMVENLRRAVGQAWQQQ